MTASHEQTDRNVGGLSLRGIGKKYGPITVLNDVNLDVRPARRSRCLAKTGPASPRSPRSSPASFRPTIGSMTWRGTGLCSRSPADALSAGIGLIHQEMRLLLDLSIAENVFVGRLPMRGGRIDRELMNWRAAEQLHRLGLDASPTTLVRDLRVAAQQQVEIAKALTLNARLLDIRRADRCAGRGRDRAAFRTDRAAEGRRRQFHLHQPPPRRDRPHRRPGSSSCATVRLVATYETAQVPIKTLVEEMVGRPLDRMFPEMPAPSPSPLIEVEGLTSSEGAFADVSFSVRPGEVFGVAGIVGAGRTELMRAISGADPIAAGSRQGQRRRPQASDRATPSITGWSSFPRIARRRGLSCRKRSPKTLRSGTIPASRRRAGSPPRAPRTSRRRHRPVSDQGNRIAARQRTLGRQSAEGRIAKSILREPKVVILDEPTRGIDVGARAAIYEIIAELARRAWRSSS